MMDDVSLRALLEQYARAPEPRLLDSLVRELLPLSRSVARRCWRQGLELEDLEQVAAMALVKAIGRYEPERGLRFSTYAVPTILGEVRNYIRDKASPMRMARDTRSQLARLEQVSQRLAQEKGREPTLKELAAGMEIPDEALLSLLDERESSQVVSLDGAMNGDGEDERTLAEQLGVREDGYELVERQDWYAWALSCLNDSERELVRLRYEQRLGQRDTAKRLGVSQMQVSRVERRILEKLRRLSQER